MIHRFRRCDACFEQKLIHIFGVIHQICTSDFFDRLHKRHMGDRLFVLVLKRGKHNRKNAAVALQKAHFNFGVYCVNE